MEKVMKNSINHLFDIAKYIKNELKLLIKLLFILKISHEQELIRKV